MFGERQERDDLHGLAEPHVVREHGAEPCALQLHEPLHAGALIGAELGAKGFGEGEPPARLADEAVSQLAKRGQRALLCAHRRRQVHRAHPREPRSRRARLGCQLEQDLGQGLDALARYHGMATVRQLDEQRSREETLVAHDVATPKHFEQRRKQAHALAVDLGPERQLEPIAIGRLQIGVPGVRFDDGERDRRVDFDIEARVRERAVTFVEELQPSALGTQPPRRRASGFDGRGKAMRTQHITKPRLGRGIAPNRDLTRGARHHLGLAAFDDHVAVTKRELAKAMRRGIGVKSGTFFDGQHAARRSLDHLGRDGERHRRPRLGLRNRTRHAHDAAARHRRAGEPFQCKVVACFHFDGANHIGARVEVMERDQRHQRQSAAPHVHDRPVPVTLERPAQAPLERRPADDRRSLTRGGSNRVMLGVAVVIEVEPAAVEREPESTTTTPSPQARRPVYPRDRLHDVGYLDAACLARCHPIGTLAPEADQLPELAGAQELLRSEPEQRHHVGIEQKHHPLGVREHRSPPEPPRPAEGLVVDVL